MKVTFAQYHSACAPLEGRVPTMYADCLGLITTGVGNLINTLAQALALPWLLADGTPASHADIAADWNKLAAARDYYAARSWRVYAPGMRCHLADAAIDALVQRTLDANEAIFRKRWSAWDTFPADAQLAVMSEAWAVGPAFWRPKEQGGPGFVNLERCIAAQDWEGCVASCTIREAGNPGVVPRNALNRFCFHNAAIVKAAAGSDASVLWWPAVAVPGGAAVAAVNVALTKAASDAQREAEAALAAWHADPLSRFVNAAYNDIREAGPHGAQDVIDDERDTDPSELAPASEGGRS